jgi:hypothetical protein
LVIDQINTLIATPLAELPFDSPSLRDKTRSFSGRSISWCASR